MNEKCKHQQVGLQQVPGLLLVTAVLMTFFLDAQRNYLCPTLLPIRILDDESNRQM